MKFKSEKIDEVTNEVILEFEDALDEYLGAVVSEQQVHRAYFRDKEFELKAPIDLFIIIGSP